MNPKIIQMLLQLLTVIKRGGAGLRQGYAAARGPAGLEGALTSATMRGPLIGGLGAGAERLGALGAAGVDLAKAHPLMASMGAVGAGMGALAMAGPDEEELIEAIQQMPPEQRQAVLMHILGRGVSPALGIQSTEKRKLGIPAVDRVMEYINEGGMIN